MDQKIVLKRILNWAEKTDDRLGLLTDVILKWVLNGEGSNGYTFFHLVGQYGSKDSMVAVLNWAEQNDDRLGLLKM